MIYVLRIIVLVLAVCSLHADEPNAVLASIPATVKTVFVDATNQFLKLKSEKASGQELYKPYAYAAGSVIQTLVAQNNPQERNELLQSLVNALKLSFWYPEIWVAAAKAADKRYEALFAKPNVQDGSDTLVGEVFARHQFTLQGMVDSTHYLITNTLYTARSNPALQGAIITGLGVFLKTYFEAQEIVSGLFAGLKSPTIDQYAALVGNIILQELPKHSPLVRGLIINLTLETLFKKLLISNDPTAPAADAKEVEAVKQRMSTFSTRQEYAAYVRSLIPSLPKVGGSTRYAILQEVRAALLASTAIIAPERRAQSTASDELTPSRDCKWYEIHCWIVKGFEELEKALVKEVKKRSIKTCPDAAPKQTLGPITDFAVLTFNTYCFPKSTTGTMLGVKEVIQAFDDEASGAIPDLQSGIYKSVDTRIAEIARFVGGVGTDVVCFQELWSDDNKETMVKNICPYYPYNYYVSAEIPLYSLVMMDDGLMISSHRPFVFTHAIVFKDRMDDEKLAHKGALFVGLYDREGKPIIVVNTHLQSGRSLEPISIKNKQMHEIGQKLREIIETYPAFKDARLCIAGDFNEALQFRADRKLLADRTRYLVEALNDEGIPVSNNQIVRRLASILGAQEIVEIDELDKQGTIKTLTGAVKGFIGIEDPLVQRAGNYAFDHIAQASDPDGTQLLDHVFVDNKSKVTGFDVYRYEVLGGVERLKGSDLPPRAISDHAAVRVIFERAR